MVVTKRTGDFSDSNSNDFEIQLRDQALTRMRVDDVEAMIRKRKQLKTTTTTTPTSTPSPGSSQICWTKDEELVILAGIVDYEKETQSSYKSNWDGYCHYIKDYIDTKFSMNQLAYKVNKLKRKFFSNQDKAKDGKDLSFTNTRDDEIFKLSMIIWGTKDESQTQNCGSNEKMDQTNEEGVSIEIDNGEKEKNEEENGVDELCEKHDTLKYGISSQSLSKNDEKEKSEEDGVDELGVLVEALEADTLFRNVGKYQQKLLLQNLEKLGAEKRKKLTDECKALFAEELQLNSKKRIFSAKLANGGVSP